ncbi:MAG: 23S rRNA (pseudouridine(1915)-N(3))-methyltransferase RlmH [Candidatus Kerfeldbacteria bacterium]|nr:23S rRNA (pseudouridine(1915)-N(3))-methyltransferase RlmH [Candidatus Kerfeldbacteria bacterium]
MQIILLSIGKTTSSQCRSLEDTYERRIRGRFSCRRHYVKNEKELRKYLQETSATVILLEERGKQMDTPTFARYMDRLTRSAKSAVFVIGDAAGIPADIRATYVQAVSLSPLTFPHELARVLILEQLYRAQTLLVGHPYHK